MGELSVLSRPIRSITISSAGPGLPIGATGGFFTTKALRDLLLRRIRADFFYLQHLTLFSSSVVFQSSNATVAPCPRLPSREQLRDGIE